MCGRYSLAARMGALVERFGVREEDVPYSPRYNVAPTQGVLVVTNEEAPRLEVARWGLIPSWAKEEKVGARMINARSETLATSGAFRRPLAKRRCLVLADGFYEWRKEGKTRTPMYFTLASREPFAFAGLWEVWRSPTGEWVRSCTIVTTPPNSLMEPVHNRMPAILAPETEPLWLDQRVQDVAALLPLLLPYPSEAMEAYQVSSFVNSVAHEGPQCILPLP